MTDLQHLPRITLTVDCNACRQVVRDLKLVSQRIMQIAGVRSVMTELDVHGRQRVIIFTDETNHSALLRRMASELRKPVDQNADPRANVPFGADPLVRPNEGAIQAPRLRAIAIATEPDSGELEAGLMPRLRRFVYGVLAAGSIGMAWVGLLVPGIPTVPFVILAATFAAKASKSFHERLKQTRVFGPMIRDWEAYGAVQPIVRIQGAAATLLIVAVTIAVAQPSPRLLLLIGVMCTISLVMIARIPVIESGQASGESSDRLAALPAVA